MGTKLALALANLFMAAVETEILNKSIKNHVCGKGISMTCPHCGTQA